MRAAPAERAASGGLVAVEALALAVGGLGVRLGARFVRRVAAVVDPAAGGLDLVVDEARAEQPLVRRAPAAP
ncbi:MAG TPA: hypothetical protein VI011_03095 [Asanoa sp.]